MKLRTAVLTSIILGCAGALLAGQFLVPLSLPVSNPLGVLGVDLGQLATTALAVVTLYAACAVSLITGAMMIGLIFARTRLKANAGTEREYLAASEWRAAFSLPLVEPLAYQIVRCVPFHEDRLLLGAPFSAQAARTEARTFHLRLLAVAQIWTAILALLALTLFADFLPLPAATQHDLLRLLLAADAIVLLALALARVAAAITIESLLSAISRLPLLEAPTLLGEALSSVARLPAEAASAVRAELDAQWRGVEVAPRAITVNRELMERLAETVASAIATGFDKRISSSLRAAEKLISTTRAVSQEMLASLTALPVQLNERSEAQRAELKHTLELAISAARATLEEGLEGSRRIVAELNARHLAEIERVISESRSGTERLTDTVVNACSTIEQDRRGSLSQMARLVEIVETYTARLLPAMRRLEANEDRLSKSIGQQDETLERLVLVVNELSGTLEALQTALGHAEAREVRIFEATGSEPPVQRADTDPGAAESSPPSISRDLQSLLDDMDGKPD